MSTAAPPATGITRIDLQHAHRPVRPRGPVRGRDAGHDLGVPDDQARTHNAGDALLVPPETVHSVRDVGDGNASELATYIVEKGKPFLVVVQ